MNAYSHNQPLPQGTRAWVWLAPCALRNLLLCLFLMLPFFPLCQQRALTRQLIFKEMGRQNTNAFLEDSYGFIWIGGGSGLYRYDGYSIQPYRPAIVNDSVQSTGAVYALLEDSEKRIWIGAANGLFRYDRETEKLEGYLMDYPTFVKRDSRILSLFEDHSGRLWIGGRQHLFVVENRNAPEFRTIEGIELGSTMRQGELGFLSILESREGVVFVCSNNGLWLICDDFSFQQLLPKKWENVVGEFQVLDAASDEKGLFWLATSDGLWTYDPERWSFSKKEMPPDAGNVILHILIGKKKEIWLGTQGNGLFRLRGEHFEHFPHDPDNPYSLMDHRVQALMMDRFHNLWAGTMFGVNRINFEQQKFPFYQIDPGPYQQDNFTFRVMEDSLGGFWFRLLRFGLGYAPGLGKELEIPLQSRSNPLGEEVKNFCMDPEGNVWVLTFNNSLFKFDRGQGKYNHINLGDIMKHAYTHTILSDRIDGQYLWFTTRFGLCRMNRFTFTLKWFYPQDDLEWMDHNSINPLEQSEDGKLWCTLRTKGINRIGYFDRKTEKFVAEPNQPGHPSFATINRTKHFKLVPGNKVWVGTDNGVIIIDATDNTYTHLTEKDSFPVKSVESITPDLEGNIWFTGPNKICKYDGANYSCFDVRDGIEHFMYWSAALGKDGRVTFGGTNGIYSFYPNEITFEPDTTKPKVYLTNFKVFNKKRHLGKAYELVKEITLPYEENVFTFEFAGLHFTQSENLRYKYILENFDKDTVETGSNERAATYTNLSPGTYTFKVWAANADGVWTTEEDSLNIKLVVNPPWYRTRWAYSLWAALLIGALLAFYRFQLNRKLAQAEARQLRELDAVKTRLYTNITHEFRTPLTIIQGTAGQLMSKVDYAVREELKRIQRNGQQLLHLVNQMLDLAKLESGSLPVSMQQGDVIPFLKYLLESFHSLAEAKDISLHFQSEEGTLVMDYDAEKMQQIVGNLLSNAVKFTGEGGQVALTVDRCPLSVAGLPNKQLSTNNQQHNTDTFLSIAISDTGIGIPEEKLPHIFSRFYQADDSATRRGEGTGIGLTLAGELVKLLGGDVRVESELGKGTIFTVLLPITNEGDAMDMERSDIPVNAGAIDAGLPAIASTASAKAPAERASTASTAPKATLLIIEDNPDVTHYLSSILKSSYTLLTASNGRAGLETAQQEMPDLILCDVMMPEMDGFEVCRRLKSGLDTSHIPIVLLTAKADTDSRIEGIEQGADAYLAKPFEERELKARLKKLLENRERLQKYYTSNGFIARKAQPPGGEGQPSPADREFFERLLAAVEKNLGDPDFSAEQLAGLLFVSYATCLRKVKAFTGQTVKEYIRQIRIHRAAQLLLEEPGRNIGAIAGDTGFNSNTHFTREFRKVMGCTPTEYREGTERG